MATASLRLVWPVRLSVVVTWRRNPTSVCWPSFPPTCHLPVPPSLHGVSWAQFPRIGGTMRHSDSSPPIPPRFVAFARRYHPSTCGSLRSDARWRWSPIFGQVVKVESRSDRRNLECHERDGATRLS